MAISIQTTQYNLIYVYSRKEIADALKIGKASIDEAESGRDQLTPNCEKLNQAALARIKEQTQSTGADFTLLHTELAWFENARGEGSKFMDTDVHNVLLCSGYKRKEFNSEVINPTEWFMVDLPTAVKAIEAVKHEQLSIEGPAYAANTQPAKAIRFREEQENAIARTTAHFKVGKQMLWNAKMRFGKTLCALELIRRGQYGRVLILTHRPAVKSGWFEDYHLLNFEKQQYGSKLGKAYATCDATDTVGKDFATLQNDYRQRGIHFIYFASMQDLRGSKKVSDKGINKNDDVFLTDWDLIILDEAHEGTETDLGKNVIHELREGRNPYMLYLSGTPFNILSHFSEEEVYTWDYVMEQEAKNNWPNLHPNEPNPYEGLARLNIYTYNLGDVFETNNYTRTEDDFFNFAEFFRVWTGNENADGAPMPDSSHKGRFVHEAHVCKFLDMLCDETSNSRYPYSTEAFRNALSHTLWMLPGVDAAKALECLIQNHRLAQELNFTTINVAGEGSKMEGLDDDDAKHIEQLGNDVLCKVKTIIKLKPRTITLSCGRLTTGVSVPEWTGVFMLRGGYNVDAGNYMQTIFRGQTPFKNGAIKTNCYAFDFAPDRTLTVIDDYVQKQPGKSGSKSTKTEKTASLLRLCPVIAMRGGQEVTYDAHRFINEVNKAYKEHVLRNGFKGRMLHKSFDDFTPQDHALLAEIGKIFNGNKVKTTSDGKVKISDSGLTGEDQHAKKGKTQKKKPALPKTSNKKRKEMEQRRKSQNVLDQIFTRLPLLLFGAVEDTDHLTIAELLNNDIIDQASWVVFMPANFTKEMLLQIAHLIKEDLFVACTTDIINEAKKADQLPVEQRVRAIARMLALFHYPDHETVLTPWRVVNMHLGETLGGYNFYNTDYTAPIDEPRWIEQPGVTNRVYNGNETKLLEINSKSGVYPLYLAYTLWRIRCRETLLTATTQEEQDAVWQKVLNENIFVLCQTEMAKKITERVLRGYRNIPTHCAVYPNLVETLSLSDTPKNKSKKDSLIKKLLSTKFWKLNNGQLTMKFNAVVSNPPYQEEGENTRKAPIYHLFYDMAFKLTDKATLITPARYLFRAGQTPKDWMERILSNPHFKVVRFYQKSAELFDNVDIKGGIAIGFYDAHSNFGPIKLFFAYEELKTIVNKVLQHQSFINGGLAPIVSSEGAYRFSALALNEQPHILQVQGKGTAAKIISSTVEKLTDVFTEEKPKDAFDYMKILSRINNRREYRWIRRDYVQPVENLDYYKVLVPKANGSGAIGEILSTPVVGVPVVGYTDTFIGIGVFDTEEAATACLKYIKTKFARTMLGTLKATQDNPRKTWTNVPMQDFTPASDIDWSQSVEEIDKQLYRKYNLCPEEVSFIERMIRPME